ncbi:MAG TPA: co-chaperone DjlA [Gammaproteobacteria bacterium]|nr:co-chaperone DjlA [Gammaproteobacteria bacterium]
MSIVIAAALLGLLFGGFRGLLIGALVGYSIQFLLAAVVRSGLQRAQGSFLDATFAVMGALSKADGVVTRDEIEATQRIFDMLRLSGEQREQGKAAFTRGKAPGYDLDAEVDRLKGAIGFGRGPLLRLFLQLQCMAVAADGRVHEAEHAMLVRIARRLGLTERDVAQFEALLRAAGAGPAGAGPGGAGAPPARARLDDAYTALGLTPEASDAEVKRAYRRLVSENHPDKLASKGLPESMRQVAEERTREINLAYELIKGSRNFK